MSQLEKALIRISEKPKDYTYDEARALLQKLGFREENKGKSSGSRVKFFRSTDNTLILLHKPHPNKELPFGAIEGLVNKLHEIGEL